MKNGTKNNGSTVIPEAQTPGQPDGNPAETVGTWSADKVRKHVVQDLQAAVSFLVLIRENPNLIDLITEQLMEFAEKSNQPPIEKV